MIYDNMRDEIRSGDLLAWSHRGWKTWYDFKIQFVRMFTRSEYSHVGVAWRIGGRVFVIESVTPLVRIIPLSTLLPCYWSPTDKIWTDLAEEFALAHVGISKYSIMEAVNAGLGKPTPEENGKWQCAKFVISIYSRMGILIKGPATPTNVVDNMLDMSKPVWKLTK